MKQSVLCFLAIIGLVFCDTNCPAGYSNRDTTHCYKVFTTYKSKNDAAAQCESEGGYLSSISNGFDNSYVYSLGQNVSVSLMWLGIDCSNTSKSSCFNDDESTLGPYDNFYSGNPSVLGNCVYMSIKNPTSAYWVSFDCDSTLPFLCEFDYGSECQPGYTKYHGSCYKVVTTPATEVDAELNCQKDCGHLASIHSDKENNFLTNFSASYINNSYLVRIGLKQLNQNQIAWTDHTILNYTNYGYVNSNSGACFGLSLVDRLVKKGLWSSDSCDTAIPYVCKTANGICQHITPTYSPSQCNSPIYLDNPTGTGTEYSPGYPGLFSYNPQCVYYITTTPGSAVELQFTKLLLVPNSTISLYNDMADEEPFAVINSSTTGNLTYTSTENEMVLVFSYPSNGPGGIWEFSYVSAAIPPHCQRGYSFNNGLCYKFINKTMTKDAASSNCKADGGMLAVISNAATNQFVWNLAGTNHIWIGLTCPNRKTDGDTSSCVWDDGTKVTYNDFYPGQPDTNSGYNCIAMWYSSGQWANFQCSNGYYSICQTALVVV